MTQSEQERKRAGTILLVDDQPDQIRIIKSALDQDFFVKVAIRGEIGLQIAATGGIDLILLDILMPGMDGYEVCRQLKSNPGSREIPVIFLTCKDTQDDEAIGLQLGAVDFIRKPSSASVVLARCHNTIAFQNAKESLRRQNEQLQQALRIREDMELMSRHDLKGPLSAILGLPEILLADNNHTDGQRMLLKLIERSGYIMLEMINRSLDLFRMENNNYTLNPEPFDLLEIILHIIEDLRAKANTKKIALTLPVLEHPRGLTPFMVMGEKMLCYSIFYNLILNAIEATCHPGEVRIHLSSEEGFRKVRVTNPGEVPAGIREHFFDKYATHGKKSGTGLGTYSAWLSARTQGGRIELDTSQPGATSLVVALPKSAATPATPETGTTRKLRILLAEDVNTHQVLMTAYLMQTPHQLVVVNDGMEAVARVQEERFDVVIMDVQMPRMDGYTATGRIRQWERETKRPPLRIIALSAHALDDEQERSREAGCDLYLAKPIHKTAFLAELDRIAAQPAAETP
ncbi:MAG: response regulator [Magnetococcales bacterium]|nr:response regulator [Magnetococcales bacterium]